MELTQRSRRKVSDLRLTEMIPENLWGAVWPGGAGLKQVSNQ